MAQRYPVVIVGGGPVGVALAVELGQRGIRCGLYERHREVGTIPKGQNLTPRSLEHFYFWHCVDELRARRLLPPGYPIGGLTAYDTLTSDYWYATAGLETVRQFYFQANERLPQYLTEEVLRERMAALSPVEAHFETRVLGIEQDEGGVRVQVAPDGRQDAVEVVEADYVVGCDGSRSVVREELGIPRSGADFDQKMVLAVFRSPELHAILERFPERTTYRVLKPEHEGAWSFFGRVDVGEGWFFHGPVPRSMTTEDHPEIIRQIQAAVGSPIACELDHVGFWELRIEVAERYRSGRVFIAGDAAHSHPPYGGFGLNTGLEDVTNLGWKLAAVLEGWGGPGLLDSYSEERQPVFAETGSEVIAAGILADRRFLATYNPAVDRAAFEAAWATRTGGDAAGPGYEPNYEGSSVVTGAEGGHIGALGQHLVKARAGHHLAPVVLADGRNAFEALGEGFTLFAFGAGEDARALSEAAARRGVPLEVVASPDPAAEAAYEAQLVLVRPDQYVAYAGQGKVDAEAVLARLTGTGLSASRG